MIKRIFALLAAVLLLCSLAACKKDATLPGGDSAKNPPADSGGDSNGDNSAGEGNPNLFFEQNGYTEDFALRFTAGADVLDTATGEIVFSGTRYAFDFTAELASFYHSLSEHNFGNLPADMTCRALSGNDAPEDATVYTFTVTDLGVTRTVTTDGAALQLPSTSNLSNLSALIREFQALLTARAESAAKETAKK